MDTGDVWLKTASLRFPAQTPGESGNAGLFDGEQTGCGGPAAATRSSARCCKTGLGNRLGTVWPENFLHSRLLVSILFYYTSFFAWYLFNQSIGVALSCCETGLKNENHHRRRSANIPEHTSAHLRVVSVKYLKKSTSGIVAARVQKLSLSSEQLFHDLPKNYNLLTGCLCLSACWVVLSPPGVSSSAHHKNTNKMENMILWRKQNSKAALWFDELYHPYGWRIDFTS